MDCKRIGQRRQRHEEEPEQRPDRRPVRRPDVVAEKDDQDDGETRRAQCQAAHEKWHRARISREM